MENVKANAKAYLCDMEILTPHNSRLLLLICLGASSSQESLPDLATERIVEIVNWKKKRNWHWKEDVSKREGESWTESGLRQTV